MNLRILVLASSLLIGPFSFGAGAPPDDDFDDDLNELIEQNLSGAAVRQLQEQAKAQPPNTTDRSELAIFYHGRGMANVRLGNYLLASADLRLALDNAPAGNQQRVIADGWGSRVAIQNALGESVERNGDWITAAELWAAMALERQRGNVFAYHRALLGLVVTNTVLGRWTEADKALQAAETTVRLLPNRPQLAQSRFRHGTVVAAAYARQGNYREAERNNRASLASAELFLADQRGRFGADHRATKTASGAVGKAKSNLADTLSTRGRYGEAEFYARSGLRDTLALFGFNTVNVGAALDAVGWTRFQQGDLKGAESYYRRALTAVEGSGIERSSRQLAVRRATLANALLVQGRWEEVLAQFQARAEGLNSEAVGGIGLGSSREGWPYALHKTGQSQRAVAMLERSIATQLERPDRDRWHLAQLRGVLGMALSASGRTADALKNYREAVPELMRRDQDDGAAENVGYWRVFWQRVILEGYLELLAKLYAAGENVPGVDLIDEAFRIADIARGSSVQEAIAATAARAQLSDPSLTQLAQREQDGQNRLIALNRVLSDLAGAKDERTAKIMTDVRAEVERLRREHTSLRAELRKRSPEYAELIDPRPVGIAEARKALVPGEALVSIYLGETQAYVWTIASDGNAAFRVVAVKREDVEKDVTELRRAVDFGDGNPARLRPFNLARAHQLYRTLFAPDEALWKDARTLNVIPHGALGELPLALLVTVPAQPLPAGAQAGYAEVAWLARRVAIAQLPSANAFTALRRTPPANVGRQPFVGFGDPLFTADAGAGSSRAVVRNLALRQSADATESLPTLAQAFLQLTALPDTSDELNEIALTLKADPARDVYLSRRATEKNVKLTKLDATRVIAFATHGIAPGELTGLDQPALVLSNPALTADADNDGFLTMEEVLGLKLNADWVVLSACNTGSGDGRGSEAVSGLGRAFFYAGARSLLVSNWAVETTSARLLTTGIFKRQSENAQLTRAEALRLSMLDLMGKSAPGGYSYAHPAFWAPFSLVGDGGR
jgi:CHAT domain-containing protein